MRRRIVVDTNVYVSRALRAVSIPGQAVAHAWRKDIPLLSEATWNELRAVLSRPKFSRYIQPALLEIFLRNVWDISELVSIPSHIRACRDPRDDKFLEVAVHGRADALVTGDEDLLTLHPFHGVAILTPGDYLAQG